MTPLLAARRQHLSAAYALHSRSKSVRLRTPPLPRLISPLWQGTASLCLTNIALLVLRFAIVPSFVPSIALRQAASAAISQSVSVVDRRATGQEICVLLMVPALPPAPHSPSSLTFTSFTSAICEITIARIPFRSNAIPVARTYFPTKGISFVR